MPTLPEFTPRQLEDILIDFVNIVRILSPQATDWNPGSVLRSIAEAAAVEDDEQYYQMIQILRLLSLRNLRGKSLEDRLVEYNVFRRGGISSSGTLTFFDESKTTAFLAEPALVGATSVRLTSSRGFPATGNIRIGENLSTVEDPTFSANNTTTGVLTVSALTQNHNTGERITLKTGGTQIISRGTRVKTEETIEFVEIVAVTTEEGRIEDGNFFSVPVAALVEAPGRVGNVRERSLISFYTGAPFAGAGVRNDAVFRGGIDQESDEQLLSRAINKYLSIYGATPLALTQLVVGSEFSTNTGQVFRVISASIREFFEEDGYNDFNYLYIWPGTFDFINSQYQVAESLETLTLSAEDGQRFFRLKHVAIIPNSLILQVKPFGSVVYTTLVQGVDYFLNEGTGWIQIKDPGLSEGDELRAASYDHYTGLIREVQVKVNGSAKDPQTYPGINSAGIKTLVTYPRSRAIDPIRLAIQVRAGFDEARVALDVESAIVQYLNGLTIGEDVIVAEIVERSMGVDGMFDLQITSPLENIILLEDEVLDLENLDILIS